MASSFEISQSLFDPSRECEQHQEEGTRQPTRPEWEYHSERACMVIGRRVFDRCYYWLWFADTLCQQIIAQCCPHSRYGLNPLKSSFKVADDVAVDASSRRVSSDAGLSPDVCLPHRGYHVRAHRGRNRGETWGSRFVHCVHSTSQILL